MWLQVCYVVARGMSAFCSIEFDSKMCAVLRALHWCCCRRFLFCDPWKARKIKWLPPFSIFHQLTYTVNFYRYKAIGANATSSVILYTCKCISPCLEMLQLLQVILQGLKDYLQELQDFQTGANAFTCIQNYTECCISPYSFVPIDIYSVGKVMKRTQIKFCCIKIVQQVIIDYSPIGRLKSPEYIVSRQGVTQCYIPQGNIQKESI